LVHWTKWRVRWGKFSAITATKEINLSTIHKSKGLQAERVFILNWHLLPSEYAESELGTDAGKMFAVCGSNKSEK
jgi:superfamily I DNA/RNA helicase